jgi:hypothetical protein
VPAKSSAPDSLVPTEVVPIPETIYDVFRAAGEIHTGTAKERQGPQGPPSPPKRRADGGGSGASDAEKQKLEQERRRSPFVNLQWALGTAGSGAPVHFHNTAWNQLFYGE